MNESEETTVENKVERKSAYSGVTLHLAAYCPLVSSYGRILIIFICLLAVLTSTGLVIVQ